MTAFSIEAEIDRLLPVALDVRESPPGTETSLVSQWEQVTRNLARLGKQQLRANQTAELLQAQLTETHEQRDEYRRKAVRLRESASRSALQVLEIIDTLDDVTVHARQLNDPRWLTHLERLSQKTLRVLEKIGLTEIATAGEAFNPEEHDALDTVARGGDQHPYMIVQVIRRGFRFQGSVLRRAEVITTR